MDLKHIFNYHVDIYPTTYIYIVYYILMYISLSSVNILYLTINSKKKSFKIQRGNQKL